MIVVLIICYTLTSFRLVKWPLSCGEIITHDDSDDDHNVDDHDNSDDDDDHEGLSRTRNLLRLLQRI